MQTLTLNNKKQIPVLGLGTWRSDKAKVSQVVEKAVLEDGYRHLDCASIYGNEKEIGVALSKILSSGKISRGELFVTSKLWNTEHHPDNVEPACRETLADLQLEYLDLYLVHWGIAFVHGEKLEPIDDDGMVKTEAVSMKETWQAMESLVDKGLVKSIGVANFTVPMIVDLLSYAKVKPVVNQIEIHPYNNQKDLIDYCHKMDIQVTAYSPLGSSGDQNDKPLNNSVVIDIAKAHDKTPAQILIRWAIQRDLIVIPKSTDSSRILENISVEDFSLSKQEMDKINKINKNHRFVDPIEWWGIPYFK